MKFQAAKITLTHNRCLNVEEDFTLQGVESSFFVIAMLVHCGFYDLFFFLFLYDEIISFSSMATPLGQSRPAT